MKDAKEWLNEWFDEWQPWKESDGVDERYMLRRNLTLIVLGCMNQIFRVCQNLYFLVERFMGRQKWKMESPEKLLIGRHARMTQL